MVAIHDNFLGTSGDSRHRTISPRTSTAGRGVPRWNREPGNPRWPLVTIDPRESPPVARWSAAPQRSESVCWRGSWESFAAPGAPKLTRCAIAALCSSRR